MSAFSDVSNEILLRSVRRENNRNVLKSEIKMAFFMRVAHAMCRSSKFCQVLKITLFDYIRLQGTSILIIFILPKEQLHIRYTHWARKKNRA